MALPAETKTAPAPKEQNLVFRLFCGPVELVSTGQIERLDLVSFDREGKLFSPVQGMEGGENVFPDEEIKTAVGYLIDELTGEINGWRILDSRTREKPQATDTSNPHHDVLTWEFKTLTKGIKIGVEKVVDHSGEVERTYYLVHSQA